MGSVYRRGNVWWIKYYRAGKSYRESARTKKRSEAEGLLKFKEGQIAMGEFPGLRLERIRFDELCEDFLTDYRLTGKKSIRNAEAYVKI